MKKNATKGQEGQLAIGTLARMLPLATLFGSLKDMVIATGLKVFEEALEAERTEVCGARYERRTERQATRMGHARGSVVLGGRKVTVSRPRARTTNNEEVVLPTWAQFSSEDPLTHRAVTQMLVGVSTRQYERSLEELPAGVESSSTSRSAVSRRFVASTARELATRMTSDLSKLDLAVMMIDGIHMGDHVALCALGIDAEGTKHVLGLVEGSTENAEACTALLTNLRERGVRTDLAILVVIDGGKALAKAVRDVFGRRALIQRCQVHKARNVIAHLPKGMHKSVRRAMNDAYRCGRVERARRLLNNLARALQSQHPGAATSLREGLDETLTVMAFGLERALERTLATTNPIENMNSVIRRKSRNVKRWRGGSMVLRWVNAALDETTKGFRRLRGHRSMKLLVAALRRHDEKLLSGVDTRAEAA